MAPWAREAAEIEARTTKRVSSHIADGTFAAEWSIVLLTTTDLAQGKRQMDDLRAKTGLKSLALDRRELLNIPTSADAPGNGKATTTQYAITAGRFADPRDPAAKAELARVRALEIDGARPFANAQLSPPPSRYAEGTIPEWNLANVRRMPGNEAKMYTLQVGVYGRTDNQPATAAEIAEFRRFAEAAAAQLRKDGDEAYYMHGPFKSMVTVGAYTPREYDERHPKVNDSPELAAAREKYQYNLVNGQGLKRRGKLEESFVTEIPR